MYIANVLQPLIDVCQCGPGVLARPDRATLPGSWGSSIILLTFTVRLLILPLTFKGVKSMQRLQQLQPEIKKIQERYKDDRQRMNQEIMAFYQREKVNPLGSCLPLLLQLPFFIALFSLLRSAEFKEDIAGNPSFLAIDDLAEKVTDPVLLGVLIVLYVGTQLAASAVTAISADPTQRRIMFALPFVFVDLHRQLPGRPDRLLDHDQRLDDRPAAAGQEALSEAGAARPARCGPEEKPARGKPATAAARHRRRTGAKAKPAAKAKAKAQAAGERERRADQGAAQLPRKKKKRSGRRR